jgi:leucyl aminopeptidase
MNITVSKKKLKDLDTDLIVIPVASGSEDGGAVRELAADDRALVSARIDATGYKAAAGKTLGVQSPRADILLVGTGDDRAAETFKRAGAKAVAAAATIRAKRLVISAGSGSVAKKHFGSVLEGYLLSAYRFDKYKAKKDDHYAGPKALVVAGTSLTPGAATKRVIARTEKICEAVCMARDLINETSKIKTPNYLVKNAKRIAREEGLKCEVWQGQRLVKEKMNGILAVSAGSEEPGALIKLVYKPKKKARGKVALVGKGITFDSGGLSLKPSKSMEWMKQDMSGAAAVLGCMQAVSVVAPAVEVHGFIAAAENMPGAKAQKPGDIIEYRNGTTAEVLNTDAEGRLVLADALCLASELKPDCIIDLATLTGACLVALGTRMAGIMGTDQTLVDALISNGEGVGEALWQLPLVEEMEADIRSMNADIQNIGAGYGGTITAALFLRRFIGDNAWAHLDIAGPAFAEKPFPYAARGGTGYGVRTLLAYLDSL